MTYQIASGHDNSAGLVAVTSITPAGSQAFPPLRLAVPLLGGDDDHSALTVARDLLRAFLQRLVDQLTETRLGVCDLPTCHHHPLAFLWSY